jgi:hypothetical protein
MKNSKEYLDKIVSIIEIPYFKELGYYGIKDIHEREYVFKQIYGFEITLITGRFIGDSIYDINGNRLYYEHNSGEWCKREFDSNDNCIYYENSNGKIYDR